METARAKKLRFLYRAFGCSGKTFRSDECELSQACKIGQAHAKSHLEQIKKILDQEKPLQLPQSNFGKAINYTIERWDALNLYLEHGTLEICNNLVENAIRPTAIGKKNFLFFGSQESGQTSAVIYSLIETCRKLDINSADYLRETLSALPTMQQSEAADWTPARWKSIRGTGGE
ncbi:IS66 family transposase [Pontiella sulfatireligans]|uniref:IS66 family transposase n=1 Tax=Pontiella sulfatireligans TaxID=2750658 RepID=UPI00109D81BA